MPLLPWCQITIGKSPLKYRNTIGKSPFIFQGALTGYMQSIEVQTKADRWAHFANPKKQILSDFVLFVFFQKVVSSCLSSCSELFSGFQA